MKRIRNTANAIPPVIKKPFIVDAIDCNSGMLFDAMFSMLTPPKFFRAKFSISLDIYAER